ncbi:MAG: HAD-IIIC family phosphatase [Gemmatimonadaceae bacterium]
MALGTTDAVAVSPLAPPTDALWIPAGDLKPAEYMRLARVLRSTREPTRPVTRLAILASHTLRVVEPFIVVEGAREGMHVDCCFGGFGQFEQELADPSSGVHRFEPTALVIALRLEDVDPDAVVRYHATGGARCEKLAEDVCARLDRCIAVFRERSSAPVLVANFAEPPLLPLGVFDAGAASLTGAVARANERLRQMVAKHAGAVVWDYAGLVRARGAAEWTDSRLWSLGRVAVAAEHQPALARHLARTLAGATRSSAKCLVLDLDNTIWGGAVGDDGLDGIALGDDYPGSVFKSFQRRVLSLMDRGILLAVVSKNDHDVVERVFREHPEMLIKWEHLAAVRINWAPKSGNLREVAAELTLGADALVLFDDNPVERAEVRTNAPEVGVIEVPTDTHAYERALAECGYFDQAAISGEDRARGESYRQERQRRELGQRFESVDDFLRNLEMVATIGGGEPNTIGRIAQLVGKTNQFNLTTRRHGEAQIAAMASHTQWRVASLRLADRFGDQGLIAVGILAKRGRDAIVDTFLMSCRVMNRRIEDALMSHLTDEARAMGCVRVIGEYIPTRKNGMVRDVYARLGFTLVGEDDGVVRYALDVTAAGLAWPDVIRGAGA